MVLAKTQIPLDECMNSIFLLRFVSQQSEFVFFGALTSVGAPFFII